MVEFRNYKSRTAGKLLLLILCSSCLKVVHLKADAIHGYAGNTAASFLNVGIGPRAVALGGAFCAVANDVNAVYWNPAGLGIIESSEIAVSIEDGFLDMIYNNFSLTRQVGPSAAVGGGISYQWLGDFEAYDENDFRVGEFNAYNTAIHLGYGRNIRKKVSLGIGWKGIFQRISDESAVGYAFDIGFLVRPISRLATGLAIQNMGPRIGFIQQRNRLPLNIRYGWSGMLWRDRILIAGDANWPREDYAELRFGVEFKYVPRIALRGGFVKRIRVERIDYRAGIGIDFTRIRLDYVFFHRLEWNDNHYTSLIIMF